MPVILFCAVFLAFLVQSKSEAAGCLRIFVAIVLLLVGITALRDTFHRDKKVATNLRTDEEKAESVTSSYSDKPHSFPFTESSTGYTWNAASERDKMELCGRLARASAKGNSASFYYDAINTFYDSHDGGVLQQPLRLSIGLIDSGSSVLPEDQRNY